MMKFGNNKENDYKKISMAEGSDGGLWQRDGDVDPHRLLTLKVCEQKVDNVFPRCNNMYCITLSFQ